MEDAPKQSKWKRFGHGLMTALNGAAISARNDAGAMHHVFPPPNYPPPKETHPKEVESKGTSIHTVDTK